MELLERAVLNISPDYSEDWRTEIMSFLQGNFLSDDETYNRRIEARARPYVMMKGSCTSMEFVLRYSSVYPEPKV